MKANVIDLFCGVGGLSFGLKKAGFNILAGYDVDSSCKYAYETNIQADFINKNIKNTFASEITNYFNTSKSSIRILVGCAPCQTFSQYTQQSKRKINNKDDEKWTLLNEFLRIAMEVQPEIISVENVPNLIKYPIFDNFIKELKKNKYHISHSIVFCPDYGIPQNRKRLVLLASKLKEIKIIDKTHNKDNYASVRDTIGNLPKIKSGEQSKLDKLHISRMLTPINIKRIKATPKNGGSWKDWDESLILKCHKKPIGKNYGSVYGRMKWDEPAPTMTTFCTGIGNGRFGHPEQDRAISLREASLLQTFPIDYDFIENKNELPKMGTISRHIGNAVPPKLGEVIGLSIREHLGDFYAIQNEN